MKYERGSFITVGSRDTLRGLHPTAQALYMWLSSYANETGNCFPSRKTLANDVGCSEDTVDKMLVMLVENGLISKEMRFSGGSQSSNMYTVLIKGGSRQNRPPQPYTTAPLPARIGTNSNQLTKTTEGANEVREVIIDLEKEEKIFARVIPSPYSVEVAQEMWSDGELRLQVLNWYFRESGLWAKATNRFKLKALMARHNSAAVRIARAEWTPRELNDAKKKISQNEKLDGEWTLETVEKYLTK